MDKEKKVFLYFRKGFSPQTIDETENYMKLLKFRNMVDKENESLYKDYETTDQFKLLIRNDLEFYLKNTFPPLVEAKIQKFLTSKPAKMIDLIGREEELKYISHMLERTDHVLRVNGLGGVGKTELCKRYFWDNIHNYIHLAGVEVVGNIRESFVSANIENPEDEDLDRMQALPFKVLANSRLKLDGFESHTLDFLSPEKCKGPFLQALQGKKE
jgi:hypothetical protein